MRLISIFSLLLMILSGCSNGRKDDRAAIAVSFDPQAWILKQISGDDFDIITLLPPGTDPETYQPSIGTMKSLGNAKAYITLGTSGFERRISDNIHSNFPELKTIDCTDGIEKITGTHESHQVTHNHDNDEDFDPHMLASIRNCIEIAENMTQALIRIRPDKAARYRAAGNELKEKLKSMDDSISAMDLKGKSFAIRHPSLSYFARDYGLAQISLHADGKEASPLQLKRRMEEMKGAGTKIFILEREHSSAGDKDAARQLNLNTVEVSLNSSTWLDDLMKTANEINRD